MLSSSITIHPVQVRGLDGTKEASVVIKPHPEGPLHNKEPVTVNIAVANGLGEAGGGCLLAVEDRAAASEGRQCASMFCAFGKCGATPR